MKPIVALSILTLALSGLSFGQAPDIRSPDIDTGSPGGQILASAGMADTPEAKIQSLEQFLSEFPDDPLKGYVYFQLQGAYADTEQWDKAIDVGKKLIEIAPNDVEVRHKLNDALVKAARYDDLPPLLEATRPIAEEAVAAPKAEDEDDATYAYRKEYAEGVVQWLEWATNTAMSQQTDPLKQVEWMDRLREWYPDGAYSQGLAVRYVTAYQQAGDQAKMYEWMEKAVESGEAGEEYLYALAEQAYTEDREKSRAYAEQILERLETQGDTPREGMTPEQWTAHKTKYEAYGNFVVGRTYVAANTKDAYRTGRSYLLQSVDFLKEEGGQRYHLLAYFLGVCYVQLDIQGDNIAKATYWMREAANTDGPFKGQAAEALKKIGG